MNCRALFYLLLCSAGLAFAQKLPNIAISPFVGDKTVSAEQLNFITGKFAGEMMKTNAFTVLDRGRMDYILKEQGFQQTGACNSSECQVQMGQLLGVDFIVSGNLVRFGSKYAFRADYIDVGSGKVVYFAEQEESGVLEDVYGALCRGAAQQLAQMAKPASSTVIPAQTGIQNPAPTVTTAAPAPVVPTPVAIATAPVTPVIPASSTVIPTQTAEGPLLALPISGALSSVRKIQDPAPKVPADALPVVPSKPLSGKRKFALALWSTALLGSGGGYYFNGKAKGYMTDYNTAKSAWQAPANQTEALATTYADSYDNATKAKTYRSVSYGVSLTGLVAGAVLWFLPEGK